jgi:hypothetical protein
MFEELPAWLNPLARAVLVPSPLPDHDDEWGWYSLMRHYAAPTRLLDWSDGVLTALYFAVREDPKDDQTGALNRKPPDACVWMLDPYRLNLLSFYPADDSLGVALPGLGGKFLSFERTSFQPLPGAARADVGVSVARRPWIIRC